MSSPARSKERCTFKAELRDERGGGEVGCCVGLRRDGRLEQQAAWESFDNAVQKTDSGSNRQEGCCHGGRGVRLRVAAKRGQVEEEERKAVIVGGSLW